MCAGSQGHSVWVQDGHSLCHCTGLPKPPYWTMVAICCEERTSLVVVAFFSSLNWFPLFVVFCPGHLMWRCCTLLRHWAFPLQRWLSTGRRLKARQNAVFFFWPCLNTTSDQIWTLCVVSCNNALTEWPTKWIHLLHYMKWRSLCSTSAIVV